MTYDDLLAAVASWTKRGDTAALAPIWITLVEARMNRELRVSDMLTRDALQIAGEFTAMPADFAGFHSLRLTDYPNALLEFLQPAEMAERQAEQSTGQVNAVAILSGKLWASPAPTAAVNTELVYYARVPAISSGAQSNWVLAAHPDAYLWGALREAANFYEDDEQLSKFDGLFTAALAQINAADLAKVQAAKLKPLPSSRVF